MVEEKLEESAIQRDVDHLGEPIGELALGTDVDQFKVITLNEPTKVMLPAAGRRSTLSRCLPTAQASTACGCSWRATYRSLMSTSQVGWSIDLHAANMGDWCGGDW